MPKILELNHNRYPNFMVNKVMNINFTRPMMWGNMHPSCTQDILQNLSRMACP
jgi:hypothetical protein